MSDSNTLTILEQPDALTVFESERVDEFMKAIREEALSLVSDPTTAKGREEIRSQAHKVSKCKTHLVKLANDSIEHHRAIVKAVTSERIRMETELNDLRDEVKAPAVEWENKEKLRKERHEKGLEVISAFTARDECGNLKPSELIAQDIEELENLEIGESWEEYQERAEARKHAVLEKLKKDLEAAKAQEDKDRELARLRKEAEERETAERARLAEEQRKKEEAERKEREEREAIRRQEEAELRERETKERIEREKQEAIKAERERIERERREEEHRKEEARKAAEAAVVKRQADEKHRASVRKQAANGLLSALALKESECAAIVTAIEKGEIPHVSIKF